MNQELQSPEPPVRRAPQIRQPAPVAVPKPHRKSNADLAHEGEDESFFAQHRGKLIFASVLVLAVAVYFFPKSAPTAPVRKAERIVTISIPPPPPPKVQPPPPPKVQPPPEKEKMEKAAPAEDKPKEAAKKADNPPPTALATGIKGDGPGMGLASSGSGIGGGNSIGGQTGDGGGGNKWGAYAGQVQSRVADALRNNATTKTAAISDLQVRIWPDASGKITRASLARSTGNSVVDAAIENQVLIGLRLQEPPPAGMKLPIVLRLSARRP